MKQVVGRAWAPIFTAFLIVGALIVVYVPIAHGSSGVGFEVAGSRAAWTLPELNPGQVTVVSGAQQLSIVSQTPWELVLASRLSQPYGDPAVQSTVLLGVSYQGDSDSRKTEWIPVSSQVTYISRQGGPTGTDGESISIDLEIHPSWDDPPGVPFVAEVIATLAAGDAALSAYAHPARLTPNTQGPISFWYRIPESGSSLQPGDSVRLDIWKDDIDVIARLYAEVGAGEWQQVVWTDLPAEGLGVGAYRFRIVDADERLLGSGIFHVVHMDEGASVGAFGIGQAVAPGSAGDAVTTDSPDVRLVVTGDPVPPGEPVEWRITLINPEDLSLVDLQAEVCLPTGWSLLAADVPSIASDESAGFSRSCRMLLLGTLQGHREKKVRLTLLHWTDEPSGYVPLRSEMSIRVTGALQYGGPWVLIREARIPLVPADDPLLKPPLVLHGRVFVDVNETGLYETDEPVVPGARIMADGREVATANRRGEFRVTLKEVPRLVWAVSDRGASIPLTVVYEEIWAAGGRLDLPISANRHLENRPSQALDESGYFLFLTQLDAGLEQSGAGASVRAGSFGPAGGVALELTGGADWNLGGQTSERRLDDLRLSGYADDGGVSLQFGFQSGLPRDVKMGLLRPTKPAETAYRFKLDIDPRRADSSRFQSHYGPTVGPGGQTLGGWSLGSEWGYAQGDVWSCRIHEVDAAYSTQGGRIAANMRRSLHERVERSGLKEQEAGEVRVEVDSAVHWSTQRWPVRLEVVGGLPRKLSPSCGLSPFDGWKWRAVAAAPLGVGIQGIEWSGMNWPMSIQGVVDKPTEGKAYELGVSLRPVYLGEERIDLSTAIQWEERTGESVSPPRLAARLRSRIGGLHDVRLELGALTLASTDNPDHLKRGDRRLALNWRVVRGQVRPWLKVEHYSMDEAMGRALEAGLQLTRNWSLPRVSAPLNVTLRASRAVDSDDVKDKARLDVRFGPSAGRLEWSGTAPASEDAPDSAVKAFFSSAPFGSYEKSSRKLMIEGTLGGGGTEWSLSFGNDVAADDIEWTGMATVGGRWGGDGANPSLWRSGRWEAGVGRSLSHKDGELRESITSVLKVGGLRGPWGVHVEALSKVGVRDTLLHYAAYHVTLRRYFDEEWAALARVTRRLEDAESGWRYRIGLERRIGEGHVDPETGRAGERTTVAFGIGLVWEETDGPIPGQRGPRIEASLAVPYVW